MFFTGVPTGKSPLLMQAALVKLNESLKNNTGVEGDLLGSKRGIRGGERRRGGDGRGEMED